MSDETMVPAAIPPGLAQFATGDGQRKMIALAEEFAAVCAQRAELARQEKARQWIIQMGPGKHAVLEAWQYLGHRAGVIARTAETRELRNPATGEFEGTWACAEAVYQGQVVGRSEQVCMADEVIEKKDGTCHRRWVGPNGAPLRHAIMGMAQTRAQSRVLASVLRFIAVLSGVEGTPAEEMDGVKPREDKPTVKPPTRKSDAKAPEIPKDAQYVDCYVEKVDMVSGEKNGKPWTRYGVKVADVVYGTFSETLGKALQDANTAGTPVRFAWVANGTHKNIVSVAPVDEFSDAAAAPREPGQEA